MKNTLARVLALGFGSGLIRPAPGTWGSLLGLLLGYGIIYFSGATGLIIAIVVGFGIGIWAAGICDDLSGGHDASEVVIDEFVGQWIALVPIAFLGPGNWVTYLAAFALFRLFDVLKPFPISLLDRRVDGGLGVMIDDVVAGLFAAILLLGGMVVYAL